MSKYYKVFSRTLTMGKREGETVYSVRPVSNGTLTTEQVAKQISTESTATTADVKAVLDRYRLLCDGQPCQGLQHRVAWIRNALPSLHYQQVGDRSEEGEE